MPDACRDNRTPFGPARVSYHAVTRYLQRIRRVSLPEIIIDPENEALAHCQAAGVTLDEVRAAIWSPCVAMAVAKGFQTIGTATFLAIASREGTIVTICEPRRRERGRLKLLSERELAAKAHRLSRRRRPFTENSNIQEE